MVIKLVYFNHVRDNIEGLIIEVGSYILNLEALKLTHLFSIEDMFYLSIAIIQVTKIVHWALMFEQALTDLNIVGMILITIESDSLDPLAIDPKE